LHVARKSEQSCRADMSPSRAGRFLYNLANGNGTIHGFRIGNDGSLEPVTIVSGIPTSAAGLAGN